MPTPTDPPLAVLDATALARLRALDPDGSRGVVTRILTVFESSLVRMLEQLTAAGSEGRARRVFETAHTLKSSSASIGALALARCCAEVEQQLRPPAGSDGAAAVGDLELDAQCDRLSAESRAALESVRSMLLGRTPAASPSLDP